MTQHITQEQAFEQWYVENASNFEVNPIFPRDCGLQRKAWHAAIQYYLDQHKAELPVLPDHPEPRTMKWSVLEIEAIQAYGAACAAHARKLALEEAEKRMLAKAAELGIYNHHATKALVEALKGEVK